MKEKRCPCGEIIKPNNFMQKYHSYLCLKIYGSKKIDKRKRILTDTNATCKNKSIKVFSNKPKKKRTKSENSLWKNKAWKLFSRYIRLRDCLKTTGTLETGICYTCGGLYYFEGLQAGHSIGGRGNYILLNENCVEAQCERCNIELKGNYDVFIPKKIREYGLEWFENEKRLSKIPIKKKWHNEYLEIEEKLNKLLSKEDLPF